MASTIEQIRQGTAQVIAKAEHLASTGQSAEAKRVLSNGARDLREVKRKFTEKQRDLRAQAQDARQKNSESGRVLGAALGSKTRGALSQRRSSNSRAISAQLTAALRPYDEAKAAADEGIAQLERVKARLSDNDARQREQRTSAGTSESRSLSTPAAPASAPPPPTPAQWAADPHGRHQLRYWDGARWTEHVSDHGQVSSDPL